MPDDRLPPARPAFAHAGPGMSSQFLCLPCGKKSPMTGRRYLMFAGTKHWFCAKCVEKRKGVAV
jgi:hypothetical protein